MWVICRLLTKAYFLFEYIDILHLWFEWCFILSLLDFLNTSSVQMYVDELCTLFSFFNAEIRKNISIKYESYLKSRKMYAFGQEIRFYYKSKLIMFHQQQNKWYPPKMFTGPFRSYTFNFSINLLAHKNLWLCYYVQINSLKQKYIAALKWASKHLLEGTIYFVVDDT